MVQILIESVPFHQVQQPRAGTEDGRVRPTYLCSCRYVFSSYTGDIKRCWTNDKIGIATFFTVMTIAEGGGRRAVSHKLRDMYLPTLKANFMVWPLVQIINFRIMPIQFQLVSSLWPCYSSSLPVLISCSHLYPRLVSHGLPISRFPMPRRMLSKLDQRLRLPIFDFPNIAFTYHIFIAIGVLEALAR